MHLFVKGGKNRAGLVAVKRTVRGKTGKSYTQTFWVRKDKAPSAKPTQNRVEDPPEAKGVRGDSRKYLYFKTSDDPQIVHVPDEVIKDTFTYKGNTFFVHAPWNASAGGFFDVTTNLHVTEMSTGKRMYSYEQLTTAVDPVEDAKKKAIAKLDMYGDATVSATIAKERKDIAAAPRPLVVENPPVLESASDVEYRQLADYIYRDILGEDGSDEYQEERIDEILSWIETSGDFPTSGHVQEAIDGTPHPSEHFEVEIAIRGGLGLSEARYTAEALQHIMSLREIKEVTSVPDIDVVDWWALTGGPELYLPYVQNLSVADDVKNEVSAGQILAYAISTGSTIDDAKHWAKEYLNETYRINDLAGEEFNDSYGVAWHGSDLVTIAAWVRGEDIAQERSSARDYDRHIREGKRVSPDMYGSTLDVVQSHRVTSPYPRLFRGTNWDAWRSARVGQKLDFGIGSFSTSSVVANQFVGSGGSMLQLVPPPPAEGVDITSLITACEENGLQVDDSIGQFRNEEEWIIRSPSLEVVRVFETGDTESPYPQHHVVRVKIADMDLVKSSPDDVTDPALAAHLEQLYLSFNEPLSHRTPVQRPSFVEWAAGKSAARETPGAREVP